IRTLEAAEDESSNTLFFAGVLIFGILSAAYIYLNYSYYDDDYDDEYDEDYDDTQYQELDEFDNTQQSVTTDLEPSHLIQKPVVQPPVSVAEPVQAVDTTVAPIPEAPPEVKTRKKWFGLFGPRIPVGSSVAETAVPQPVAAEPVVAQPVAAEPVVAQPVAAEPVVAQPVAAEPVVAQPVVAEPVVAQPVVAEPVVVEPVVAEAVVVSNDEDEA
ncbi:MAG: hypothetical protein VXX45_00170, partial [Candidatus Thermoplasmatota archaeon]|nr:hypothetical protein [Candidatus Thermoplasmatota archaeon]